MTGVAASLRRELRDALRAALKARDEIAISALRSTLATIENAEAVALPDESRAGAIERSRTGVGGWEVARRDLSQREVEQMVDQEIEERVAAARGYQAAGERARGERLRAEAAVLAALLAARESR